jgi:hypothetical protein
VAARVTSAEPTVSTPKAGRLLEIELTLDGDDDLRLLRGALLAAKETELAEMQRRGYRLSTGHGSTSAREGTELLGPDSGISSDHGPARQPDHTRCP